MPSRGEIYAGFYGLSGRPFHVTADPRSLYLGEGHKEALAAIIHGIGAGKGFIVVTGEVGVGKTTVLRAALDQVGTAEVKLVYIAYPQITVGELLRQISETLGGPAEGEIDVGDLLELLIEHYRQNITVAVVIDEAQRVTPDVLETLRLLSNFETDDDKLVQTILVGQPELEVLLARHDMRQFRSRVAFWVRIRALSRPASHAYIAHRLRNVGSDPHKLFSRAALRYIVREARGFPRSLNIYCDNALLTGFGYQAKKVTRAIVREALAGFHEERDGWFRRRLLFGTSVAGGIAVAAVAGLGFAQYGNGSLAAGIASTVATVKQSAIAVAPSLLLRAGPAGGRAPEAPAPAPRAAPLAFTPPAAPLASRPLANTTPIVATSTAPAVSAPDAVASTPAVASTAAAPAPQPTPAVVADPPLPGPPVAAHDSNAPPPRHPVAQAATKVIVRRGDTLDGLAVRIYGRSGSDITAALQRRNKGLANSNHLEAGRELVFPALATISDDRATSNPQRSIQ